MHALLLSAGLGTRLRPITNKIPKCMVEINGKVLLDIWIRKLEKVGVENIIINTHYMHNIVEEHMKKRKDEGKKIELHYEEQLLGTAGTLEAHKEVLRHDDCLVIHTDNIVEDDLTGFIKAHKERPSQCNVTMMTYITKRPHECGIIKTNSSDIVTEFHEKSKQHKGNHANGAVYLLAKEFWTNARPDSTKNFDLTKDIIKYLTGKIYAYKSKGYFDDIGSVERLKEACEYFRMRPYTDIMKDN